MKIIKKIKNRFQLNLFLKRIEATEKKKHGKITLFNKNFYYHYGPAFYYTYVEIFQKNIYEFKSESENPLIIDCGANIGLSILYFSKKHPKSEIIAFEPDPSVVPFLEKNITSQRINNVNLYKRAVWNEEADLKFYTDHGLGGRVQREYKNQEHNVVKSVRLRDFLKRPIELLKIDIEGAEYTVIKDCKDLLVNVRQIFIEYHSIENEEQHLEEILSIIKEEGFRYHLKESFSRRKPFVDKKLVCEKFDMAINIFAYKNE